MPEALTIRSSSAAAPVAVPRRRLGGLAAAILGAAILAGAGLYWTMGRDSATHYVTRQISRGPIVRAVTTSGTVNPVITVQIGTYVSGVIEARYCDYNTQVKKGQICAKIDPRPYQVVVDQDKANLGVARAQLVKDQANLVYAKLAYDRNKRLAATKAVSQDVLDASKNALDQASAQIGLDEATIALAAKRSCTPPKSISATPTLFRRSTAPSSPARGDGPDRRRELPDADAVPGRNRSDHHAGRHQCLRERHRRDQARRQGVIHRRILPQPRLQRAK